MKIDDYYVYIYLDPRKPGNYKYGECKFDHEPFYVGKGVGHRWKNIKWNRTNYFKNKINKIKKLGLEPIILKLYKDLSENKSLILEKKLINSIGRKDLNNGPLINMTNGGDGSSGWICPNELLIKYRKDYSYIENEFRKKNYRLITKKEEYINNKQKLKYICSEGHICHITWNNFQQGQTCCKCSKKLLSKKLRKNFNDIEKEFEKRGCVLLTKKEDYINSNLKLKYICPFGREHLVRWGNFQQGHKCHCYRKKTHISLKTIPLASYEIVVNDDPTLETISLTLFVAGCVRRCLGCQNPDLQKITSTNHIDTSINTIKKIIEDKMCLIKSVTFCGGDFLPQNENELYEIARFCKSKKLRTIIYTGELYEKIDEKLKKYLDIIVDGPYDQSKKQSKFPASSNQRCWINGELVNCDNLKINEREISDKK